MPRYHCAACKKPRGYCYCHTLEQISNVTSVIIIRHKSEARHAIGTANIAKLSLENCTLFDVDQVDAEQGLCQQLQQANTYVMYPNEGSIALSPAASRRVQIKQLVVLDGTWRKTRRLLFESRILQALPSLRIEGLQSRYRIRKVPNSEAVSTVEAIAAALGVLEPATSFEPLINTMDWMIDRQIKAMGADIYTSHYRSSTD